MSSTSFLSPRPLDLRRLVERLDGLPLRPTSARSTLDAVTDDFCAQAASPAHPLTELDPGWVLARMRAGISKNDLVDPLTIVADNPWWRVDSDAANDAVTRLWRHALAVSFGARRLARDAGDPDPGFVGRTAFLHRLGLWAVAAVDPNRLVEWFAVEEPSLRREWERRHLGDDAASLGRSLAERWNCDPLVIDAAWLHGDDADALTECADDPARLTYIRQAHALAEQTPWAMKGVQTRPSGRTDPHVRLLMAEVQSRSAGRFIETDATPREERLSRETARLRSETARLKHEQLGWERLASAMAESSPQDRPEVWAERAGLVWCDVPGVAAARVVWIDRASATEIPAKPNDPPRLADTVFALGNPARPVAEVHLWTVDPIGRRPESAIWSVWAKMTADRRRLQEKLDAVVQTDRKRIEDEASTLRKAKLDALGEFAAGAGHELNNPLAVILGRAQLLLSRETDLDAARGLRAIIVQAQRAHRILRDLMYVARPPETRPRPCSVDEILKTCLRDAQPEADARGIKLVGDPRPASPSPKVWVDPDSLRHIADILVRNALEATPAGGAVAVGSSVDDRSIRWTVKDSGRGLVAHEAEHLFDPFFCGRQAGRGLGLGLPRAARIIERAGGDLTWQSAPGQGTSFQLKFPISAPPPAVDPPPAPRIDRATSVQ